MSQLLLLQRGCTSIVCEGAAKPAAITSCLGAKKPPGSKDTPKPLLRERQLQSSVISKGSVGSSNPVGRGPVLGFHSPCRSARVPSSPSCSASGSPEGAQTLLPRTARCLQQHRLSRQSLWAHRECVSLTGKENILQVCNLSTYCLGTTVTITPKPQHAILTGPVKSRRAF